jgi:hypothetical protein
MITRMTIEFKTKKAAQEFLRAINEELDVEVATLDASREGGVPTVEIGWDAKLDPTELIDALSTARDEMEWDFDE